MSLPNKTEAQTLLEQYVTDHYQLLHAQMVATAMEGYANHLGEDTSLWYITGLLHDLDFQQYPHEYPARELEWFRDWGYPQELIHAVAAHAYGYNGFEVEPETQLAAALLVCDEITGIFYTYQKLNPVPFGEMKPRSIKKRFRQKDFAAAVDRDVIQRGCEALELELDTHIENMVKFLADFQPRTPEGQSLNEN